VKHHGRGLFRISQNRDLLEQVCQDYRKARIARKDVAMLEYAEKLTVDPCHVTKQDFETLQASGFKDDEALDVVQVAAYFNFVNRIVCGLGVQLEEYWDKD